MVTSTRCFTSADSSLNGLAWASNGCTGTHNRMSSAVNSAITPTPAKAICQPKTLPAQVPSGAPIKIATVSPNITREIARARWSIGTAPAATSAAMPK